MKKNFIVKLGDFIFNFRYLFLTIFIGLIIICGININNVQINYDITSYLNDSTETKRGLSLMKNEFGELNELQILIKDVTFDKASEIYQKISDTDNVSNVSFGSDDKYYKDNNALMIVYLDQVDDASRDNIVNDIKSHLDSYQHYIYIENGEDSVSGMNIVLSLAVIVIILVLILTSNSYFEIVLAFLVFGISILLNMGSNFLFGEISYITKSIAVVLQLGLSLDYFVIFMNHYNKEINDTNNLGLAIKKTISKSILEIVASSLTTIAGLMALVFMQLKIGADIGFVLSKGILCSLITVIFLLPCLVYLFKGVISKTKHKTHIPNMNNISKFIVKSKIVILPVFICLVLFGLVLSSKYDYVYNVYSVSSYTKSSNQIALKEIDNCFGSKNRLAILVKNSDKDYNKELNLVNNLNNKGGIVNITSIGGYELGNNLYLGSKINYKEFSSLFNVDINVSLNLFGYFAKMNGDEFTSDYKITIIDLINFLEENKETLNFSSNMMDVYYNRINSKIDNLESADYTRFILELDASIEGTDTSHLIDSIRTTTSDYYDDVTLVGESISAIDLGSTFKHDNNIITMVTIIFIFVILMCSFKSFGMSILLILAIEGSILINFGISTLLDKKIFFIAYIIVSAIQMGATIDYAIVLSTRYLKLRDKMDKKEALVSVLNDCIPAIMTSGLILTIAGFLIGFISDSGVVSSIGISLGIGTLVSMIITIFVLPTILYACDKFIMITNFSKKK